jgi:hypothetical protein
MEFNLNNRILRYEDSDNIFIKIEHGYRGLKNGDWKKIEIQKDCYGYNFLVIGKKQYKLHRIIAYIFLNLDINDTKQIIDHIDNNPSNNNIENLRITTQQQNCFNKKKTKGYCWYKSRNKFLAYINKDYKHIHLGYFDTEEEARQAYLDAKQIYHII